MWYQRVTAKCIKCNFLYDANINIGTGDIDPPFCSSKCGEGYYSHVNFTLEEHLLIQNLIKKLIK